MFKIGFAAIAAAAMLASAAQAAPVSITQTQIFTVDGEDMFFDFLGLTPSDGSGGTVTIASGTATNQADPVFDGLDLDAEEEYFDLTFDGASQGLFNCGGGPGITAIPGNSGGSDCDFVLVVPLADAFLMDNMLAVGVLFSDEANHFGDGDEVIVTLDYTAIPLPAAFPLFLVGIAGLGFARRRRKNA